MDRIFALDAEVFGGFDDPGAEEMLPHPIDLHAGRQGMLGHDQPAGEPQSIGGAPCGHRRKERRGGERTFSPGLRYSPRVRIAVSPRLGVAHDHDARELVASIVVELVS